MKVISQDGGLASLVFIPDEVKPLKGINVSKVVRLVAERYSFAKVPGIDEAREKGAKFQSGVFRNGDREIAIGEMGFFNDAISITTTDCDDSELALNDFVGWLRSEFGYREPHTPPIRWYQSDLIVKFDNDPAQGFAGITNFINFLHTAMTPEAAKSKKPVEFGGIWFGADPSGAGPSPEFTLSRRANVPWHLGLWFSKAHMTTRNHIQALAMLDELLRIRRKG